MMISIDAYVRQGGRTLRSWAVDPRVQQGAKWCLHALAGFLLSAASLGNLPLPLVMALVCTQSGWQAVLLAVGGICGYWVFWGQPGVQCMLWSALGLAAALIIGHRQIVKSTPLLMPAVGCLLVAATGVGYLLLVGDSTPIGLYLLRVVLAGGAIRIFTVMDKDPFAKWMATGFGVLALAQVMPMRYLGLGFVAAGLLGSTAPFPSVAVAGLALDLARITTMPMTAVLCMCYLLRLLPIRNKLFPYLLPGVCYLMGVGLCSIWDFTPLPGLILGGLLGIVNPKQVSFANRKGETGVAQVRLELAAGVFAQIQQILLEAPETPVDEGAVMQRCMERACGSCPCRKGCKERALAAKLPARLLRKELLNLGDLPISCKKTGRLLTEIQRGQEQLRAIQADRQRQKDYKHALLQQYQFAAAFLQDLSDQLNAHLREPRLRFSPEVTVYANREREENGDKCLHFAGTAGRYYVILCDGMGTGMGAADEADTAVEILQKLLQVGYPAEHALRSLNSLCALRGRAGAVTVDVAELELSSGKGMIYKWGAAPSLLLTELGAEKIGTVVPPPGLSVTQTRETAERLSLRRKEALLLLSDGVSGEDVRCIRPGETPGEVAHRLLERGSGEDDATIAVIRLNPAS